MGSGRRWRFSRTNSSFVDITVRCISCRVRLWRCRSFRRGSKTIACIARRRRTTQRRTSGGLSSCEWSSSISLRRPFWRCHITIACVAAGRTCASSSNSRFGYYRSRIIVGRIVVVTTSWIETTWWLCGSSPTFIKGCWST